MCVLAVSFLIWFNFFWFDLRAPRSSENVLLVANFQFTSQTSRNVKDDTIGWSLSGRILNLPGARMRGWASGPGELNASAILDEATGKNSAQFRAETGFCDLIYCDFAYFITQTCSERVRGYFEH